MYRGGLMGTGFQFLPDEEPQADRCTVTRTRLMPPSTTREDVAAAHSRFTTIDFSKRRGRMLDEAARISRR